MNKLNAFIFTSGSFSILIGFFMGCAQFIKTADRKHEEPTKVPIQTESPPPAASESKTQYIPAKSEFEKYSYELGFGVNSKLSESEKMLVNDRAYLRRLERAIESDNEQKNYAKILPLLNTDSEKIEYLLIPSVEGRLAWANRNKIWSRTKPDPKMTETAERQDISIGMSAKLVRQAWGEPESIEISGSPIYKNERWKYIKDVPTLSGYKRERRFVFFESGRVVGWETE